MKFFMDKLLPGITAGLLIGFAGAIYERVDNHYIGAVLFAIGLIAVLEYKCELFTGQVGYLTKWKPHLATILAANVFGAWIMGMIFPMAGELARLDKTLPEAFVAAFGCGILMFLAVNGAGRVWPLLCVPAFILAGFEHSIADAFYLSSHRAWSTESFVWLLAVAAGNAAGALTIGTLILQHKKNREKSAANQ
ncbi:MAG: formate/nitrite transporter family protein [Anaerovoracaceae bacterium]|nr:formate/nitrite transporter family protein [Anaerovoracaceae bacterium]